ncbi:MAG: Tyrosine--tRNA ligase [Alphaproteobacteria bacterium MarineAlpha11_Bin1]|nr:MAG: Tyrosine--tRNA ligase [Alphaproteobacteria bacterium MarineAlpha11_Bin1]|tara:strand:- start:71 stop:1327 length:1257 start_codon:yes stop_codon:yes gene_type:complete
MTDPKSDFLRNVTERGFVHQCTDIVALDETLDEGQPKTCYIGFDCTADSLHVGSLLPIMLLRWFQKSGHKPIVLMGGGTTKVGDPSGKDEARQLITDEAIASNKRSIQGIFEKFLKFGEDSTDAIIVDNADWLDRLAYIPFLRDYGQHFSVNRMLSFESVKLRLSRKQPMSFLEFNYMILQAYDFMELNRRYGCILQMGGSDQWGNIVNGVELARRVDKAQTFGLTSPLITNDSGTKMGKTVDGAVWLNSDRVSPYEYWQFWRNTADADVGNFLRLFTDLPLDEIQKLETLRDMEINEAKKILATETTAMCHGRSAAEKVAFTAAETFEHGQTAKGLPTVNISAIELADGIAAFSMFARAGLVKTNGEARRLIRGGGARLNDVKIVDENSIVSAADADGDGVIKLSAGKKRHVLIRQT